MKRSLADRKNVSDLVGDVVVVKADYYYYLFIFKILVADIF